MRKSAALGLAAVLIASIVIRFSPLFSFLYWGSDTGEYVSILRAMVRTGHLTTDYDGWGITYPFFPGMVFVQGAAIHLAGAEMTGVVALLIPVLGALAVVPVFLIALRIHGGRGAALFAAAFLAGAIPHAYTTAHPAPAALGSLFALTGLLLFLRLGTDRRIALPLVLVTGALIATHHLSGFFFVLMVIGAIVLRNLIGRWTGSRGDKRKVVYAFGLVGLTFAYWFGYAETFRTSILPDVDIEPWWALLAAFPVLLIAIALLVYARTRIAWRYRPSYPDVRGGLAAFAAALVAMGLIGIIATMVAVPGTTFAVPLRGLLYFVPLVLVLSLAAAGRRYLDFCRDGLAPSAWFLVLLGSALVGIAAAPRILIPYRHAEYLMVPLAVFAGIGVVHLLGLTRRGLGKAAVLAACGALLVANGAFAIPPSEALAGWREGTRPAAIDAAYWARDHASGLVAADHHASTTVFGFGGINATWDRARAPFLYDPAASPLVGLSDIPSPSGVKDATYVWIDEDMVAGLRVTPLETAAPIDPRVLAKFGASPFVKVFDGGYAQLYWIAWGCDRAAC